MATIDEEIKSKFMNDKHRFTANLMFTSSWIRNSFASYFKAYGISSPQFNILRILKGANDWVTMNHVKSVMVEKSPNTTRLADKLIDKELIERKRSESDRRVVYVKITTKGLNLLKEIDDTNTGEQTKFLDRISEEEARQMSEILDKLRG